MLDDIQQIVVDQAVGTLKHYDVLVGTDNTDGDPQGVFMKKYCSVTHTNRNGESVVYKVFDTFLCSSVEQAIALRERLIRCAMEFPA